MSMPGKPLLTVQDLRSYLATSQGVVRAVDGVSLTVHEAEILGIVGESGCGKTVTCRTIMGLMPAASLHASGEVVYHPRGERSILNAPPSELRALRGVERHEQRPDQHPGHDRQHRPEQRSTLTDANQADCKRGDLRIRHEPQRAKMPDLAVPFVERHVVDRADLKPARPLLRSCHESAPASSCAWGSFLLCTSLNLLCSSPNLELDIGRPVARR